MEHKIAELFKKFGLTVEEKYSR